MDNGQWTIDLRLKAFKTLKTLGPWSIVYGQYMMKITNTVGDNTVMTTHKMNKGKIVINAERCKGCLLCIAACPRGSIRSSRELNKTGYTVVMFDNAGECTGCGMCYMVCPDCAIEVYK
jgi:2-oxoglutarate ferredoxin oxidoreductase subunit delta